MHTQPEVAVTMIPATSQQEGVWFHAQIHGASYWNFFEMKAYKGHLNPDTLKKSLNHVVSRHPALTAQFRFHHSRLYQLFHEQPSTDGIFHLSTYESDDREFMVKQVHVEAASEEHHPFSLENDILMRFKVLQFGEISFLLLTVNHIVTDVISMQIFWIELSTCYNAFVAGEEPGFGLPESQYFDYAAEQYEFTTTADYRDQEKYWQAKLAGLTSNIDLGFSKGAGKPGMYRQRTRLSPDLVNAIRNLSLKKRLLHSSVFQTAYYLLLHKYSRSTTIAIVNTVNGRGFGKGNFKEAIGLFAKRLINLQEIREEDPLSDLMEKVNADLLASFQNSDYPYERLVRQVRKEKSEGQVSLVQAAFNLVRGTGEEKRFTGLAEYREVQRENIRVGDKQHDIKLSVFDESGSIQIRLDIQGDDNLQPLAGILLEAYLQLLQECVTRPQQQIAAMDLLTTGQRWLLETYNDTRVDFPRDQTIVDLLVMQAAQTPDHTAVLFDDRSLSYRQLDHDSNQLGQYLRELGIREDVPVAICLDRSFYLVTAILGILKAGGAYVPIDPDYPAGRIAFMLQDSAATVLITDSHSRSALPPSYTGRIITLDQDGLAISTRPDAPPVTGLQPHHLAYIIYTSGSTGTPKGAMNQHDGLVNRLLWARDYFRLSHHDTVLQKTTFCFDVSVWELLLPLVSGGRLLLAAPGGHKDPAYLSAIIDLHQVTCLHFVPSMLEVFLQDRASSGLASLRQVICSGEELKPHLAALFSAGLPTAALYNLYGPTEAAIDVSCWPVPRQPDLLPVIPIGKPIANVRLFVLDNFGQPVPPGFTGELCIGGIQVARGYLNRPELTREKFVPDPFSDRGRDATDATVMDGEAVSSVTASGARLYRTGDLARWLPDGTIEYLGRIDHQVKIRGFRIELGEIETVLLQSSLVRQCVVLARPDSAGHLRLTGYVVSDDEALDWQQLTAYLRERLPEHMIPAFWVAIDHLPLTPNGKLDTKALPEPDASILFADSYEAPASEMEAALAAIWQHLLGIVRIGIHDNFFTLGGDSIISIQVINRARQLGYRLQPKDIFLHPTVGRLAAVLTDRFVTTTLREEQGPLSGPAGLLPIQQWYFHHEQHNLQLSHFNQSLLCSIDKFITPQQLSSALAILAQHHDALRFHYQPKVSGWQQFYGSRIPILVTADLQEQSPDTLADAIEAVADRYQQNLDIGEGDLLRMVWIKTPASVTHHRLLIIIHHLAVDGVSWRTLLDDLDSLLTVFHNGGDIPFMRKGSSCRDWFTALTAYAQSPQLLRQVPYWQNVLAAALPLPVDYEAETPLTYRQYDTVAVSLSPEYTRLLLQEVPPAYHTEINDLLLAALARVLCQFSGHPQLILGLEGHGREESITSGIDLTHTVGWFTSLFPVLIDGLPDAPLPDLIKTVKEQLRQIPDKGLGFGVLRYLHPGMPLPDSPDPWNIVFNYLGQSDNALRSSRWLSPCAESTGQTIGFDHTPMARLSVNSRVFDGQLQLHWSYSRLHYQPRTIRQLADAYLDCLCVLIDHCLAQLRHQPVFTPSDYGLGNALSWRELDHFLQRFDGTDRPVSLFRLSGLQEGMLFHHLYTEEPSAYVGQLRCQLQGVVPDIFAGVWQILIQQHSSLRTAFYYGDFNIPVQAVFPNVTLPVTVLDYRHLDKPDLTAAIHAYEAADIWKGFDLTKPPLTRLTLLRITDDRYHMIWTMHHLIIDGWSVPVLLTELQQLYEQLLHGGPPALSREDRFEDHIRYVEQRDRYEEETFWKTYLRHAGQPTVLPFIGATTNRNMGIGVYKDESILLDRDFTGKLDRYARQQQLTINTIVQGVWAFLLHCYTASPDITYGVTISGRSEELTGIEQRVGLYINTLPLYTHIDPSTPVTQWLQQLQEEQVVARAYQHSRLTDIQKWTGVTDDWFDSLLVFENYPVSAALRDGTSSLKITDVQRHERTNYPLTITIAGKQELGIGFSYNSRLLDSCYVRQIAAHFREILCQLTERRPERLADLSPLTMAERQLVLEQFNDTIVDYPHDQTVVDLFIRQAAQTPDLTAVIFDDRQLSYRQLDHDSNQLGQYLRELGIREDMPVAICLDRSLDMITGILGILKAGGAYVPIDPDYPAQRIAFILQDSAATVVVTDSHSRPALPPSYTGMIITLDKAWPEISSRPLTPPATLLQPHHLAYIIYTSGSTGTPKGAMNQHDALVNRLLWARDYFRLSHHDTVLQKTTFCFDVSVWELILPLISGARLVLAAPGAHKDPARLAAIIDRHQVTCIHFVPSMLEVFLQDRASSGLASLRQVICSGEELKPHLAALFSEVMTQAALYNLYGPTEAAIDVTCWPVPRQANPLPVILIGKPIANVRLFVLDKDGQPVPPGIAGELYIGGIQVGRGYLNRPELTREKFVSGPAARLYRTGDRLYHTGDRARWLPDGNIEYLGRIDHQVKIRGYRVELGEIETALLQTGLVRQCSVQAQPDSSGNRRLIGYIVGDAAALDRQRLTDCLRERLPDYMVPALWMSIDKIPLTANGKIDIKALPEPDASLALSDCYVAPGNELESALAGIWQNLLGAGRVGTQDNFFELGGDSLLILKLLTQVNKILGKKIRVITLFEYPTIQRLLEHINGEEKINTDSEPFAREDLLKELGKFQ